MNVAKRLNGISFIIQVGKQSENAVKRPVCVEFN